MEVTENCPKCESPISEGYGLAGGVGIGPYRYCESEACDFFEKEPERLMAADSQGWLGEHP